MGCLRAQGYRGSDLEMGSGARHLSTQPLLTLLEEVIMNIYELMNIHDNSDASPTLLPLCCESLSSDSLPDFSSQASVSLLTPRGLVPTRTMARLSGFPCQNQMTGTLGVSDWMSGW